MDLGTQQMEEDNESGEIESGCDCETDIEIHKSNDKSDDSGDEGKSSCELSQDKGGDNDSRDEEKRETSTQKSKRIGSFTFRHIEEDDETNKSKEQTPEEPRYVRKLYSKPEICIEFPFDYKEPLEVVPVSNEEKNSHILDMPQSIKEHSELLGSRDRSEMFKIKGKLVFEENCKVMIKFSDDDECDRYLNFYAVVKQGKDWFQVAAKRMGNSIGFETKGMEYFYIMSSPVTKTLELTEDDPLLYVHECDPQTIVSFEAGTVQISMKISIKVLPVSKKAVEALDTSFPNPIIKNISPCLFIQKPEGREFKKNTRVQLPFKPTPKSKTLVVRLDDDKAEVTDTKLTDNLDGTYSCHMKAAKTCSFVQTRQSLTDSSSKMEDLLDEVLFLLQEAKRCRLITFHTTSLKKLIRTNIVSIEKESEVTSSKTKMEFNIIGQVSPVITIRKGQRIRADLRGAIQKVQKSKGLGLFAVFQPHLDNVHMEFSYVLNRSMGTTPEALIHYSSDNFSKRQLHAVHFNPETVAPLPRANTPVTPQGIFSEASLKILANKISADDWYQLAIGFDFSGAEMDGLQSQVDKGQAARGKIIFLILVLWSKKSKLSGPEKVNELLSVLKDCVPKNVLDTVEKVFKQGRALRTADLK